MVQIRECLDSDLPVVVNLLNQLSETTDDPENLNPATVAAVFEECRRHPEFYLNLVAEAGGRVVGFESIVFYKTLFHKGGTALINELVVDHSVRGSGIGAALVERTRQEALTRGMDEMEVGTECDNHAARAFYARCGFDEEYVLLGMEFD